MAQAKPRIDPGQLLECRVARLLQSQGSFCRRRVDLRRAIMSDRVQVTDIDVLSFDFRPDLALARTAVECKSGGGRSAPKEVDRIFWLAGLRSFAGLEHAMLVASRSDIPRRVSQIGEDLGIVVQSERDIARREALAEVGGDPSWWGSHHPDLLARDAVVRRAAKQEPRLEAVLNFLTSDAWLSPPPIVIKKSVTALRTVCGFYVDGITEDERTTLRWLLGETIVAFSVAALQLAHRALILGEAGFRPEMEERFAEGDAPYAGMVRLSKAFDVHLAGVLKEVGVGRASALSALGAFQPVPPDYFDALAELVGRLAAKNLSARWVPIVLDAALQGEDPQASGPGGVTARYTTRPTRALARLILKFIDAQVGLPSDYGVPSGLSEHHGEPLPPKEIVDTDQSRGRGRGERDDSAERKEGASGNEGLNGPLADQLRIEGPQRD